MGSFILEAALLYLLLQSCCIQKATHEPYTRRDNECYQILLRIMAHDDLQSPVVTMTTKANASYPLPSMQKSLARPLIRQVLAISWTGKQQHTEIFDLEKERDEKGEAWRTICNGVVSSFDLYVLNDITLPVPSSSFPSSSSPCHRHYYSLDGFKPLLRRNCTL